MTKIQMTETLQKPFGTLENCGCALRTVRISVIVCGFRLEDSTNFGFAACALKTTRASNFLQRRCY